MDVYQQQQNSTRNKEGSADVKQQQQSSSSPPISPASPPSASSSPSHEFSFTISLHSSSNTAMLSDNNKAKTPPSNIAIDLSPADDIFFHGHLLPLHLLSHLPVSSSPRSSTNSLDSFTLPTKDDDDHPKPEIRRGNIISKSDSNIRTSPSEARGSRQQQNKSKSFSLFNRWQKRGDDVVRGTEDHQHHHHHHHHHHKDDNLQKRNKKKRRFVVDVSHVLKRYVRKIRPFLFFRGRNNNKENLHIHGDRHAYSFSGNLSLRNKKQELMMMRGRRGGEYSSAPASMRTSPTNSGLLVATSSFPSSTCSDSTMEELQAAIQAAIAHCKKSINGGDDKLKC